MGGGRGAAWDTPDGAVRPTGGGAAMGRAMTTPEKSGRARVRPRTAAAANNAQSSLQTWAAAREGERRVARVRALK